MRQGREGLGGVDPEDDRVRCPWCRGEGGRRLGDKWFDCSLCDGDGLVSEEVAQNL
jgi:hypothetical protein